MDTYNKHCVVEYFIRVFPSLLVLFTVSARFSCSVFPTLHGCARSSLLLSRDIWCGMVEAKGTWYLPWFPLSFLSLTCPFLPWWDLGRRFPWRCFSAEGLWVWLGCFCFMPPGETLWEARLYFYLTQALWREKWTFALHVCVTVLLTCFLSKVHISQCGTFLANRKHWINTLG